MANIVTNVYVKFNYDRLRMDKALGNFQKSDSNNKNNKNTKNNVSVSVTKTATKRIKTPFVAPGSPFRVRKYVKI